MTAPASANATIPSRNEIVPRSGRPVGAHGRESGRAGVDRGEIGGLTPAGERRLAREPGMRQANDHV